MTIATTIAHYQIVASSNLEDFEDEVEAAIDAGMVPFGYPFFGKGKYHQAMIATGVRLMEGSQN